VLEFKDWYKQKEEIKRPAINARTESICDGVFKIPSKLLTIHHVEEETVPWSYDHSIDRLLITTASLSEESIEFIKSYITEGAFKGKKCFIASYDFSTRDSNKCFKNSKKSGESLVEVLKIDGIESRGFGNLEELSENIKKSLVDFHTNTRIEIWALNFELNESIIEKEIPFSFNANDYLLLDSFKSTLRGILNKLILLESKKNPTISCMKSIPLDKGNSLNEQLLISEGKKMINRLNYPISHKSSYRNIGNKPSVTKEKLTIKGLTIKRSESICNYLNKYTSSLKFKFIPEGIGAQFGKSRISIKLD